MAVWRLIERIMKPQVAALQWIKQLQEIRFWIERTGAQNTWSWRECFAFDPDHGDWNFPLRNFSIRRSSQSDGLGEHFIESSDDISFGNFDDRSVNNLQREKRSFKKM